MCSESKKSNPIQNQKLERGASCILCAQTVKRISCPLYSFVYLARVENYWQIDLEPSPLLTASKMVFQIWSIFLFHILYWQKTPKYDTGICWKINRFRENIHISEQNNFFPLNG